MHDFTGATILITGAAGNLGRAVAAAFAERGAVLALIDVDAQGLEAARGALPTGCTCAGFTASLVDPDSVADMVQRVIAHLGRIDTLVNIAGGFTMGPPVHQTEDADWTRMLDLNARTVFNTCRAVVPHLLARGSGTIVNVSARAALEGKAYMAPYCVSKAAVITLTESLAAELKDQGIRVNCILPGTIDTPQNRAAMPDADAARWVAPGALADLVLFLASEAARAVNGAAIPAYGRG